MCVDTWLCGKADSEHHSRGRYGFYLMVGGNGKSFQRVKDRTNPKIIPMQLDGQGCGKSEEAEAIMEKPSSGSWGVWTLFVGAGE